MPFKSQGRFLDSVNAGDSFELGNFYLGLLLIMQIGSQPLKPRIFVIARVV